MKHSGFNKKIWFVSALILLIAAISFSWFFNEDSQRFGTLSFRYDRLFISDPEKLSVELWVPDGDGFKKVESAGEIIKQGMMPNDTVNFRIRLYNNASTVQRTSICFKNIKVYLDPEVEADLASRGTAVTDEQKKSFAESFMKTLFFGYNRADGEYAKGVVKAPANAYISFQDASYNALTGQYTLMLFRDIEVPVTPKASDPEEEDSYAELDCYFYLGKNTDSLAMDMVMDIGSLGLIR